MAEPAPIIIPRENVNDESVKLLAWLVGDREPVQAGQAVAEVESSKTVTEIVSPAAGTLLHGRAIGDEVEVGGTLGHVSSDHAAPATAAATNGAATAGTKSTLEAGADAIETRFSAKALQLLERHSIDRARFANRGLVRAEDVQALMDGKPQPAHQSPAPPPQAKPVCEAPTTGAAGVPVRAETLSRAKKLEARYLSTGLRTALPSVVTVACPTRGLRQALSDHPMLRGQSSPIIIFEAARLLRAFPVFNAYAADDEIRYYEQINIGFAVDAGRGLKVPVIHGADAKSLPDIAAEMQDLVVQYLDDALPTRALAGGTFTITDLSGEGVFAFHPLINQGQSAILGVGAEFFPPGADEGMFNLMLAFDHRVTEGRAAAKFLNELKHRLGGYEKAMDCATSDSQDAHCQRCYASLSELTALKHYLLTIVGADGKPGYLCTRCAMGLM